jgi:hypothetical protein
VRKELGSGPLLLEVRTNALRERDRWPKARKATTRVNLLRNSIVEISVMRLSHRKSAPERPQLHHNTPRHDAVTVGR